MRSALLRRPCPRRALRLAALLLAGFAWGCASQPAPVDVAAVGPGAAAEPAPQTGGTLVVYSDWVPVPAIDVDTHVHSAYRILNPGGDVLRRVDETVAPQPVLLAPGRYTVEAMAARYGQVRIPVVIAADRATTVCLTGELDASYRRVPSAALVRLPDGRVVGWSSP